MCQGSVVTVLLDCNTTVIGDCVIRTGELRKGEFGKTLLRLPMRILKSLIARLNFGLLQTVASPTLSDLDSTTVVTIRESSYLHRTHFILTRAGCNSGHDEGTTDHLSGTAGLFRELP